MNNLKRLFVWTTLVFFIAFLAGAASPLLAQRAKGEQAKEEALKAPEQAQTEAQTKEELENKRKAEQAAAQAKADAQAKSEQEKAEEIRQKREIEARAQQDRSQEERALYEHVVRTYSLKYISVREFIDAARFYIVDSTGSENALTVRIIRKNIPDFEALLKKLDVEKKNIQFQVYTIVASKDDPPESYQSYLKNETKEITDRDLKRVLDEMKGLWNFKHYWVDSPSFLMAKDGSGSNHSKLVSRYDFELNLHNVRLRGDDPGKRIIAVGEIQLIESLNTPNGRSPLSLIDTSDITLKEKGYLVVGVSGLTAAWGGLALILVISAEIK